MKRAILFLMLACAWQAWPQSSTGSVRGTVRDQSEAIVPNAVVTLTNSATNATSKSMTNESGSYVFPAVIPGDYSLRIESAGLQKYEAKLTVLVQQSATIDATLKVAAEAATVSVTDVTPVVVTDRPDLGHVLERQRIEQLPINGRSITNLLQTVPGLEPGQVRSYGVRQGAHDFILDGAALSDPVDGEGTTIRPPGLDTIQEFLVENNASSAKFSRPTTIILTTRSGTNLFHGSLFETLRNNAFGKARSKTDVGVLPTLIRNEYGGTAGGPLYIPKLYNGKNRSFWFFSYEGFSNRNPSSASGVVPTDAMRNGDFSQARDSQGRLQTIYDPLSTNPTTWARTPFPGNIIPKDRESPLAKYAFSVIPLPTYPDRNPLLTTNWFGPGPSAVNQWTVTSRFDQNISDRDKLYGRFTTGEQTRFASSAIPMTDRVANFTNRPERNYSLAVSWTHSFTPSFFNELLVSGAREYADIVSGDPNVNYDSQLNLPNPLGVNGFPVIGNFGIGTTNYFQPANRRTRWLNYFILEDNATKLKGKHELQFGVHLRLDQWNILPQQTQAAGNVSFATLATSLWDGASRTNPAATPQTGLNLANLFLGVANYSNNLRKGTWYTRRHENAFYFQDNYKITSRMTLNLGVRWELNPFMYDKHNVAVSFDPKQRAYVLGDSLDTYYKLGATLPSLVSALTTLTGAKFITYDQAGLPQKLVHDNWHDIGPSVGFAYRALSGKKAFVVRSGFSTKFYPEALYNWNDSMTGNTPFSTTYQNSLTDAAQSPDGISNYGMRSIPTVFAGLNSQNAVSLTTARGLTNTSGVITYFNPDQPTSRVHTWNFTLEKEILPETVLRVGYVGVHGTHDDETFSYAQSTPTYVWYASTGTPLPTGANAGLLQRPFDLNSDGSIASSVFGTVQELKKTGYSWTNGLQLELEHRYRQGFAYQFQYAMLNALRLGSGGGGTDDVINDVNQYLPGTVPSDVTARHRLFDYQRETSTPKHRLRWNWILDLPFGNGKLVARNSRGVLEKLIGGWQLTGIGSLRSNWASLPSGSGGYYPTGVKIEQYGFQYPIQDCTGTSPTAGGPVVCTPGYLWWNGYIPANRINSQTADGRPNGIEGVPSNYKPAVAPLIPQGSTALPPNAPVNTDVSQFWDTNTVWIPLKDGTVQRTTYAPGFHPLQNQYIPGVWQWGLDAGLVKNFRLTERANLRFNMDAFNVLNSPGTPNSISSSSGILSTIGFANSGREVQFTLRLAW
jgi:Carboxypeptidase regulatory-like domain